MQPYAGGAAVTSEILESTVPGLFIVGAARAGYGGTLTEPVADGERAAKAPVAAHAAHSLAEGDRVGA